MAQVRSHAPVLTPVLVIMVEMDPSDASPSRWAPDPPKRRLLAHTPPPWVRPGCLFFITVCCQPRHVNQLCNPETASIVLGSARHRHELGDWFVRILLLMPDHMHMLAAFPPNKGMVSIISLWKGYLARMAGVRWQKGFFDHRIRNDKEWDAKAGYIRMNPVRAGIIADSKDWPYVWEPEQSCPVMAAAGPIVRTDGRPARPYLRTPENPAPGSGPEA